MPDNQPGDITNLFYDHHAVAILSYRAVSDNMIDLWIRFAKTGDPNGGINVSWPKYTRDGEQYLDINSTPTVMSGY